VLQEAFVQEWKVTDIIRHRTAAWTGRHSGQSALLLGFAIFALLWILRIPFFALYVPNEDDISNLASSLLLAPGVRWYHWFTRGDSQFFDLYPDFPAHGEEFAWVSYSRPVFQFVIYLTHFVLGRDWAAYQVINCFAIAGMGAIAFQIAQTVLGLRVGPSVAGAILVVLSPPLWVSWLFGVGYAIEPLATLFVAGAFLAVLARRDFLCLALLFLALLTKETTLWAPLAAGITVMLRANADWPLRRQTSTAAAMLLPLGMWLGLRYAFFGGVGGTYATAGYTPFADFLKLVFVKLTHLHYLLITYKVPAGELFDREIASLMLDRGTALLIYALLSLWVLRVIPEAFQLVRSAIHDMRWPSADPFLLVTLWASIALAFHFMLPLAEDRYATSVVIFTWPALVTEIERRGKAIVWIGLAAVLAVSLSRTSYLLSKTIAAPLQIDNYRSMNGYRPMNAVIAQAPTGTRQIYVLSAGGLQVANPEYVGPILGVSAEIVRLAEIVWKCSDQGNLIAFDHSIINGTVSLNVTLPPCANLYFYTDRFNKEITDDRLYRNDRMSYELPEVDRKRQQRSLSLGQRMTVHLRPKGPARFIVEHGRRDGIAWFDTP
jgi:hypothetical protein